MAMRIPTNAIRHSPVMLHTAMASGMAIYNAPKPETGKQSNKKQCRNYKFIKFQFFGSLFYQNCFHHIFRSVEFDNGVLRRRNICRFNPLLHHLKGCEVLRQSLEAVSVATEDDGCSGDDRSPSDEGERPLDIFAFALFIHHHNHVPVYLHQLHKVTSDDFIKLLQSAVGIFLEVDFSDRPADGIDFYCTHHSVPYFTMTYSITRQRASS